MTQIQVYATSEELVTAAADLFVQLASSTPGDFTVALAGGSTPLPVYAKLATAEYATQIDWGRVHIFFSDERAVPPTHADSNYSAVQTAFLGHVPVPLENVHRMRGELGAESAAKEYGLFLKAFFNGGPPAFHLSFLGMGGDGHTASLFPHNATLLETEHRVRATGDAAHPHPRITMTAWALNTALQTVVLVAGEGKAEVVRAVLEGPHQPQQYPIQFIAPENGALTWMLDEAAAAKLSGRG